MEIGHLHLGFRDFDGSVRWMKNVLGKEPGYSNQNMATFDFGHTSLVFDRSEADTVLTVALKSGNCEKDFLEIKSRGAQVIEGPTDQPWGVRTAYLQGPGQVTIEIEQTLK